MAQNGGFTTFRELVLESSQIVQWPETAVSQLSVNLGLFQLRREAPVDHDSTTFIDLELETSQTRRLAMRKSKSLQFYCRRKSTGENPKAPHPVGFHNFYCFYEFRENTFHDVRAI